MLWVASLRSWAFICLLGAPVDDPIDDQARAVSTAGEVRGDQAGPTYPLALVLVSVRGLQSNAVLSALRLRTHVAVVLDIPPGKEADVYVGIRPSPGAASKFSVEVIVSDGRAYDRQVEVAGGQAERTVATTVAQLLAAIEDDTVTPDRADVPLPSSTTPETQLADPPRADAVAPVSPSAGRDAAQITPPARDPYQLGVWMGAATGWGLPRLAEVGPLAAGGGVLGMDVSFPQAVLLGTSFRFAARTSVDDLALLRFRVAMGAGYRLRVKWFELPVMVSAVLEPWWVLHHGDAIFPSRRPTRARWVAGGAIRLSPRVRIPLKSSARAMAVGLHLELEVTSAPAKPLGTTRILVANEEPVPRPVFRVGGVELWTGLDLTVWFSARRSAMR